MPDPTSIFAAAKGGAKAPPAAGGEAETDEYESSETAELPPDFEDYAIKAFPDLEGDEGRMRDFWNAVKACVKAKG